MIRRKVVLSPDALADRSSLYDWIAERAKRGQGRKPVKYVSRGRDYAAALPLLPPALREQRPRQPDVRWLPGQEREPLRGVTNGELKISVLDLM